MSRSKASPFATVLFQWIFRILTLVFLFAFASLSFTTLLQPISADEQNEASSLEEGIPNPWSDIDAVIQSVPSQRQIVPNRYRLVEADIELLDNLLSQAPVERMVTVQSTGIVLLLPLPDGTFGRFRIEESPIMEPALAAKYPAIKTYRGVGIDDPSATARLDRTPAGFHGFILSSGDTVYIDPYTLGDIVHYMSYYKSDYGNFWEKSFTEEMVEATEALAPQAPDGIAVSGPTLRTYRLAVAANAEYTQFHGGVAQALAAVNTTVNRVDGIFERELSVRMTLVANNDLIIFTDPTLYTNNNGVAMLSENQNIIDNTIGNANYDIGHVFSTGGGGVATTPSVCRNTLKARGVTGSPAPVGDAFDVDYVAHEIGHQFGANHTFNADGFSAGSCGGGNRNGPTAYEPGGGTTVMAYAGICNGQDIQPHSDDYFHAASIEEIISNVTLGTGSTCGTQSATGNTVPTAAAGANYTIPKQTPFTLTGSATDGEGDTLTYGWEEYDAGPAWINALILPNNDVDGNARAIFRSLKPVLTPARTFPALASILDGTNRNSGESLPNIARTMDFRLTVRDNKGGVNHDDMSVTVASGAGPFAVTVPNTALAWAANSQQNVTWNVANTAAAPVSCASVNILLSTDGGTTFASTLATNTPNDGSQQITLPNQATSTARMKVACAGNIFFDISDTNFTIGAAVPVGPKPDLVVQKIVATGNSVQVVIQNQGAAAVPAGSGFWVDVYIDPSSPPTKPNEIWNFLSDEGLVWGVDGAVLPMEPGEVITLTLGDALYWPNLSNFTGPLPAGTPIYAQVDSANTNTNYGGVLESHENGVGAYNNIAGPAIIAVTITGREIFLPQIDGSDGTASSAESQVENSDQNASQSILPSRTQNETEE